MYIVVCLYLFKAHGDKIRASARNKLTEGIYIYKMEDKEGIIASTTAPWKKCLKYLRIKIKVRIDLISLIDLNLLPIMNLT